LCMAVFIKTSFCDSVDGTLDPRTACSSQLNKLTL
jgi:hypothetical protein